MKYIYLTLLSLMATLCATAQEYAICIAHGNMQDYALTTDIDSIYFDASGTTLYVQPIAGGSPVQFAAADVQAISSLPASDMPLSLLVNFNGDAATIANPFCLQGVSVETPPSIKNNLKAQRPPLSNYRKAPERVWEELQERFPFFLGI